MYDEILTPLFILCVLKEMAPDDILVSTDGRTHKTVTSILPSAQPEKGKAQISKGGKKRKRQRRGAKADKPQDDSNRNNKKKVAVMSSSTVSANRLSSYGI